MNYYKPIDHCYYHIYKFKNVIYFSYNKFSLWYLPYLFIYLIILITEVKERKRTIISLDKSIILQ